LDATPLLMVKRKDRLIIISARKNQAKFQNAVFSLALINQILESA
jgi:hypothetical protein